MFNPYFARSELFSKQELPSSKCMHTFRTMRVIIYLYARSIVRTRLVSLDETARNIARGRRATMGRGEVHLHTRDTNVAITNHFGIFTARVQARVFSALIVTAVTSDNNCKSAKEPRTKKESCRPCVPENCALREDYSGAIAFKAMPPRATSCLRFVEAVPETANLTFKHPTHKSAYFPLGTE